MLIVILIDPCKKLFPYQKELPVPKELSQLEIEKIVYKSIGKWIYPVHKIC